jgi:DNA-binding cell septation regulator SpoVG
MNIGQPERLLPKLQTCNNMYITDVKLHHFGTGIAQSSLRAYAGMNLDNFVFIKYLRVLIWKSGDLFVGMSYKKRKERKYYD